MVPVGDQAPFFQRVLSASDAYALPPLSSASSATAPDWDSLPRSTLYSWARSRFTRPMLEVPDTTEAQEKHQAHVRKAAEAAQWCRRAGGCGRFGAQRSQV